MAKLDPSTQAAPRLQGAKHPQHLHVEVYAGAARPPGSSPNLQIQPVPAI